MTRTTPILPIRSETALLATLLALVSSASAQKLAFPTAEGYGKFTVGGRGGKVYEVTTLEDGGPGSLRAAVEASGPLVVVFRVSGTITLSKDLTINNPYITIAGQTAPGDGITLRKHNLGINADEVILRYIRIRYGDEVKTDADAVSMRYRKNLIIDHVSASWGDDETMSIYHGENITVQWSLVAETLNRGGTHGFAGIWGAPNSTYHHNLIANCVSRNIRFASGGGDVDYRNNVIYNWGYNSAYGGEQQQVGNAKFNSSRINMVANYYKPGPATEAKVKSRIINPTYRGVKSDYGKFHVSGNHVVGNSTVSADNWKGGVDPAGGSGDLSLVRLDKPWESMPIQPQTAVEAYESVLQHVGCSFPKRDAVDLRILAEVATGKATYGKAGIIESQTEVGGWPTLASTPAPKDTDHDGMPDTWEKERGLDASNAEDRNGYLLSKDYTNLEVYLNSLPTSQSTGVGMPPSHATWSMERTRNGRIHVHLSEPGEFLLSDPSGTILLRRPMAAGTGIIDLGDHGRGVRLATLTANGRILTSIAVPSSR